jgi:ketosteroid isomerase-like protein
MSGELQAVVQELFAAFDRNDFAAAQNMFGDDAQGIDEISRRWLRTKEDIGEYFRQLASAIQNLHSELRDVHEIAWGDTGLVTCWLEQHYVLNNQPQHISAPTTIVLRRSGDSWRLVLAHSIPLPVGASR